MTVFRIASRLEKLERRSATGSRRFWLYVDEIAEIARAEAEGRFHATGPRVLETSEEWQKKYRGDQCNAH